MSEEEVSGSEVEEVVEQTEQVDEVDVSKLSAKRKKKHFYRLRLLKYFDEFKSILVVGIDNVGSKQMQDVRIALRGKAVMLMGKNTLMRKVIREKSKQNPALASLLPHIKGNMGFVFTNGSLNEVRKIILEYKVPAAAKSGAIAPVDVFIPPGPTGMDPGQTSFFQALNIATKIQRGAIEIIENVHLIHVGDKVTTSHVALLGKLNIKPFTYGITVDQVYENGSVYAAAILDLSQDDLLTKFMSAVGKIAALGMAIGYPSTATVPFQMRDAFKKICAIGLEAGFEFGMLTKLKSGAAAAKAAAPAAGKDKKEEKEAEEEEEEESSEGMAFDMFGDGGDEEEEEEEEEGEEEEEEEE
jgi:large subunit ribosomal protein LP0